MRRSKRKLDPTICNKPKLPVPVSPCDKCAVCSSSMFKSISSEIGENVCLSCYTFFQNCIKMGGLRSICRNNQKCVISGKARFSCSSCRISKCLAVGLQPNKVQEQMELRKPSARRSRPSGKCSNQPLEPSPPDFELLVPPDFEVPSPLDFEVPSPLDFEVPSPPAFEVLLPPDFEVPSFPDFEAPSFPDFEAPSFPDFEVPTPPDFEVPSPPDFEVPSPPAFEVPSPPDFELLVPPDFEVELKRLDDDRSVESPFKMSQQSPVDKCSKIANEEGRINITDCNISGVDFNSVKVLGLDLKTKNRGNSEMENALRFVRRMIVSEDDEVSISFPIVEFQSLIPRKERTFNAEEFESICKRLPKFNSSDGSVLPVADTVMDFPLISSSCISDCPPNCSLFGQSFICDHDYSLQSFIQRISCYGPQLMAESKKFVNISLQEYHRLRPLAPLKQFESRWIDLFILDLSTDSFKSLLKYLLLSYENIYESSVSLTKSVYNLFELSNLLKLKRSYHLDAFESETLRSLMVHHPCPDDEYRINRMGQELTNDTLYNMGKICEFLVAQLHEHIVRKNLASESALATVVTEDPRAAPSKLLSVVTDDPGIRVADILFLLKLFNKILKCQKKSKDLQTLFLKFLEGIRI